MSVTRFWLCAIALFCVSCAGPKDDMREMELLVLGEDVPAGTVLTEAMCRKQTVEFKNGALVVSVPWQSRTRVIGLKTVRDLSAGERLSWRDLEMNSNAQRNTVRKKPRRR